MVTSGFRVMSFEFKASRVQCFGFRVYLSLGCN